MEWVRAEERLLLTWLALLKVPADLFGSSLLDQDYFGGGKIGLRKKGQGELFKDPMPVSLNLSDDGGESVSGSTELLINRVFY